MVTVATDWGLMVTVPLAVQEEVKRLAVVAMDVADVGAGSSR